MIAFNRKNFAFGRSVESLITVTVNPDFESLLYVSTIQGKMSLKAFEIDSVKSIISLVEFLYDVIGSTLREIDPEKWHNGKLGVIVRFDPNQTKMVDFSIPDLINGRDYTADFRTMINLCFRRFRWVVLDGSNSNIGPAIDLLV